MNVHCSSLEDRTNSEDNDGDENRAFATKLVGYGTVYKRSSPCQQQQRGHKSTLDATIESNSGKGCGEALHRQHA